jgi:hypothetical protein
MTGREAVDVLLSTADGVAVALPIKHVESGGRFR